MRQAKPKYKHFFLKNGLEIILVERPEKYTSAMAGYFRAGSIYEDKKISGASHFVEHLLFRGNKKIQTAEDLDKEKDRLGLSHGAVTEYDHVRYYASFPPQEIENALEFSSFLLFESLLKEKEIEKERQVMIEEEKLREDNLDVRSWDLTLRTRLNNKKHPLVLPREGLFRSIKTLDQKIIRSFYKKHFSPINLIMAISCPFELPKLQKIVEKVFSGLPIGGKVLPPKFSRKDFSKFAIATEKREVEKTYLYLTFPAFALDRPQKDRSAISLLSIILRLRLDKKLYYEKGLSYDWDVGWSVPTNPIGVFWNYSSCEPKNLREIIKIFFEELRKLQNKPATLQELNRARDYLNKTSSMDFDILSSAIDRFLYDFFYRERFYSPEELILIRNSLKPEYLYKIAKEVLDFQKLNVCALGPVSQKGVELLVKTELEK